MTFGFKIPLAETSGGHRRSDEGEELKSPRRSEDTGGLIRLAEHCQPKLYIIATKWLSILAYRRHDARLRQVFRHAAQL